MASRLVLGHLPNVRKRQAKLTDFVNIYCDHRGQCSNKKCTYGTTKGLKPGKGDVAFVEHYTCDKYRGTDELGPVRSANVKEVGIWKPGA